MKHNKNADTLKFLLLFTTGQRKKNIEKSFVVNAGCQKRWKTTGFGSILLQYLPNPKSKFPVNHKVYLSYFQLAKKLKRFH